MLDRKLILASKSPRRSHLLNEAGIPFEIRLQDVEETFPDDMPSEEVAEFLSRKKAAAIIPTLKKGEIVLAADSVVILDDVIYGKPVDYDDAFRIIRLLSGRTHSVITGVCLASKEKTTSFSGISEVTMEELSDEEIDYYIKNFKPYDKAGAYAIQEWIGLCKISSIKGTYSNIMGLPVDLVYKELSAF